MPRSTKKRPAWLAEAESRTQGGADPEADTGEMPAAKREKQDTTQSLDPSTGVTRGVDEAHARASETPSGRPPGVRAIRESYGALPQHLRRWLLLLGAAAIAAMVLFSVYRLLVGAPSGVQGTATDGPGMASGARVDPGDSAAPVQDTSAVFGSLRTDDGEATLRGAGLSWEGEVEEGETGRTITLKGPTAVQIREGFQLPNSSITSGLFAVAQVDGSGGEVLHVAFHTFEAGDTEVTQGSIFAVEDDRLDFTGYYRDERKAGSEKVVRTYMPPDGENYRVSFEAPKGTPIPLLVGFKGIS